MKKVIALFLILFTFFTTTLAQNDCQMCGDWIGTYSMSVIDPDPDGSFIYEKCKMHIRIKQHGNNMSVRVKTYFVKNPNDIQYWNDCNITSVSENSISFSTFVRDSFDWNSSDRKNGKIINKASYWNICTLSYERGKLVLYEHLYTEYYDKNGAIIGTHSNPISSVSLYQDDDDW